LSFIQSTIINLDRHAEDTKIFLVGFVGYGSWLGRVFSL